MKLGKFFKENKGFKQFLIRILILFFILVIIQFVTQPFINNIDVPEIFNTVQYTVLGGVLVFAFFIFFLLIRERVKLFKKFKFNFRNFIIFFIIGGLFNFLFFYIKYYISLNLDLALTNSLLFIILRYLLLFLSIFFFALSILGYGQIKTLVKNFRKEIEISVIVTILFTVFSLLVQETWEFLSFTITNAEYFLLSLFFDNVISFSDFNLGVGSFIVNIGKVCSGIESILLFTFLYLFIFFLDRKKLNYKKMLLVYPLGLIGIFIVNIIRIFLLMLVGILYSPKLAVSVFHTNLGWVLFILYFFVFWYFIYKWVRK